MKYLRPFIRINVVRASHDIWLRAIYTVVLKRLNGGTVDARDLLIPAGDAIDQPQSFMPQVVRNNIYLKAQKQKARQTEQILLMMPGIPRDVWQQLKGNGGDLVDRLAG